VSRYRVYELDSRKRLDLEVSDLEKGLESCNNNNNNNNKKLKVFVVSIINWLATLRLLAQRTSREGEWLTFILDRRFLRTFSSCLLNHRVSAARSLSSNALSEDIPRVADLAVAAATHCQSTAVAEGEERRRATIISCDSSFLSNFRNLWIRVMRPKAGKKKGGRGLFQNRKLTLPSMLPSAGCLRGASGVQCAGGNNMSRW